MNECPGDSEGKRGSLVFAWGLGFFLAIVVWCVCLLRLAGIGQNKDRVQVHHKPLFLESEGLGMEMSVWNRHMMALPGHALPSIVLEDPQNIIPLCPFQGGQTIRGV